jgi:transcriptional regulator with PAS, ATPase and Fis domain
MSWIGANDLKIVENAQNESESLGPLVSTISERTFDSVELLYNYPKKRVAPYIKWLKARCNAPITATHVTLSSPTNFGEIYEQVDAHLQVIAENSAQLSVLLSPGTPAMQAVWILLGKTRYPCSFIQSSREQGVQDVDIPFQLAAEYIPVAKRLDAKRINQLADTNAPLNAAFNDIVTHNPKMLKLKQQAQVLAEREVPVLIYGETGTGKELFSRAIHNASERAKKPFIPLNCGAIPGELVDSVLFGHKKGAFTGATADKPGVFEQADGGTLFLDEFGELEPQVQVRLLRVLQDGTFTPIGGTKEQRVNVRLITATHRNLMEKVAEGSFREDLFYRVAIGVLHLPPIREREGDLSLLAKQLLKALADEDDSLKNKKISPDALNIILSHPWRGNVRELQSTLLRAALWSQGDKIIPEDMRQSLFEMPERGSGNASIMSRDVSQGIDLDELVGDLTRHYIPLALDAAKGKKADAAKLLGLKNHQTLDNRMKKYGLIKP